MYQTMKVLCKSRTVLQNISTVTITCKVIKQEKNMKIRETVKRGNIAGWIENIHYPSVMRD